MNTTQTILRFIEFLAQVSASFNKVAIFAENQTSLHTVTTRVSPFKGESSEYAEEGATIAVFLNAELRAPVDSEKKALGMSLLLRHTAGLWVAEAEVGWSGEMVGWDPIESKESRATSIEELMNETPPLVEWMGGKFAEALQDLKA